MNPPEDRLLQNDADDPLMTVDPLESFDPDMPRDPTATAVPLSEGTIASENGIDAAGTMVPPLDKTVVVGNSAPAGPAGAIDPGATVVPGGENTVEIGVAVVPFDDATLGTEAQSQIMEVCSRFENAWKEGDQEPNIERFVPDDLEQETRQCLAHQLLLIDIRQREQKHKKLQPSEYLSKLPDCREAVQAALSRRKSSVPRGYGSVNLPPGASDARHLLHADDESTRYRQTKFLARGGLGAVYYAKDEELFRQVALKEILPEHAADQNLQEKFLFEAEVTGFLEHPGIVPVYGLGRYEDNQPYYAMRFIRGQSFRAVIEEFHRENASPSAGTYYTREFRLLLRRLIETCNAIHYAHEHGVLHRDIKPENVMLGNYGETLVVDWGLAMLADSATDQRQSDKSSDKSSDHAKFSGSGRYSTESRSSRNSAVGTPMFMSPEQAWGKMQELDGRTDVYALGAMLFNIVSGEYTIEGTSAFEVITNVRNGKTKKLTSVVPAAPKALASICEKAMALEPANRYATATELAEDIDRWLNDEVVLAHIGRESVSERSGRLIRRYRSWTISGAAALLIVTTVAIVSALLINSAKKKEEIAKLQATEFKQDAVARYRDSRDAIDTWLVQSSDALQFFPGTQSVRTRLLTLATEDYAKLAESSGRDPELELERGRALLGLGQLLQLQKDNEAAIERYREALDLFRTDVADVELAKAYRAQQAETHRRIGLAFAEQNNAEAAKQEYQLAIGQLTDLLSEGDDVRALRVLATAQNNAGELNARLGDTDTAVEYLQASLRGFNALGSKSDSESRHDIARTHELLGRVYAYVNDHAAADEEFSAAVNVLQTLVKEQPQDPPFLNALASVYVSRANSYRTRGLQTQMIESLEMAASEYRALRRAMPDVPRYTQNLVITLVDLGLGLHDDDFDQLAREHLIEALELSSELVAFYGQIPDFRDARAVASDGLGQILLDTQQDPTEAIQAFAVGLSDYQNLAPMYADHPEYVERLGIIQSHYGQALARDTRYDDARAVFEASLKILSQLIDAYPDIADYENARAHVHYRFALMLHHQSDEQATKHFESARDAWVTLGESGVASYAHDLAWLLATCPVDSVRDAENAVRFAQQAADLAPGNARFQTTFALAALLAGDAEKAATQIDRATKLRVEPVGRDLLVLAMIQAKQEKQEAAEQTLTEAEKWVKTMQPFDPDLQRLQEIADHEIGSGRED